MIKRLYVFVLFSLIATDYNVFALYSIIEHPNNGEVVEERSMLNLDKCLNLISEGEYDLAIENLLLHKRKEEKSSKFTSKNYAKVMVALIEAHIFNKDIVNTRRIIDELNSKVDFGLLTNEYLFKIYYAESLINLHLKNWDRSIEFSKKALSYDEGEDIFNKVSILSNLIDAYLGKDDMLQQKIYVSEVIEIFKSNEDLLLSARGESIFISAVSILAYLYESIDKCELAIDILEKEITRPFKEENKFDIFNTLANIYITEGKTEKAIELLENINFADNNIDETLIESYYILNDSKLIDLLRRYTQKCYNEALDIYSLFSIEENDEYWWNVSSSLMIYNNLAATRYGFMVEDAYNNMLFIKNLKISSTLAIMNAIKLANDTILNDTYNKVKLLRDKIMYNVKDRDSIDEWRTEINNCERVLFNKIPSLKKNIYSYISTWKEVRESLGEEDLAIEFSIIPELDSALFFRDIKWNIGAMILSREYDIPKIELLVSEKDFNDLIAERGNPLSINDLYNKCDSNSIYFMIWEKLEPYMLGKKNIYFSPIGDLNSINHNAILDKDGEMFGNKYNLVRVSSTSMIAEAKRTHFAYETASVYGGITFDESIAEMKSAAQPYQDFIKGEFIAQRSQSDRGKWDYLQGTKVEAEDIFQLLSQNGIESTLYMGNEGNEESFKYMNAKSPSILHIATHGFFAENTSQLYSNMFMPTLGNYSDREDYKSHTGLLLAGANNIWTGKVDYVDTEDGILTADEISRLDLSGTSLVVLSACETAKGQIDDIEGVYGLQRAFKEAGVKSIIMSLWKVDDDATQTFMKSLYSYILNGAEPRNAMQNAMRDLKNIYPDPYYWASFVMLD